MATDQEQLRSAVQEWLTDSVAPMLREGGVQVEAAADSLLNELAGLSRTDHEGKLYAPDQFTLTLNPDAAAGLGGALPELQASLSRGLEGLLSDQGYELSRRLHISLATDPTLEPGEVKVIAWHSGDPLKVTQELDPERVKETGSIPEGAFLMVAGRRHMALSKPELRIGRLRENDLVLDDPHVSRRHALLRLEQGRYIIYDLDSTAGTKVNGVAVRSHTLKPGDVIRLADNEIIYGEEPGRPPDEFQEYEPPEASEAPQHEITPFDMRKVDFPTKDRDDVRAEEEEDEDASASP